MGVRCADAENDRRAAEGRRHRAQVCASGRQRECHRSVRPFGSQVSSQQLPLGRTACFCALESAALAALRADIGRIDATLVAMSPQAPDHSDSTGMSSRRRPLCLPTSEPRWRGNSASRFRSRTNRANLRRVGRAHWRKFRATIGWCDPCRRSDWPRRSFLPRYRFRWSARTGKQPYHAVLTAPQAAQPVGSHIRDASADPATLTAVARPASPLRRTCVSAMVTNRRKRDT